MQQVDLQIDNGFVITMDPQRRMIRQGTVVVDQSRILAVGRTDDLSGRYEARKRIDARGNIVMPGLVDAHMHNTQQLSRGMADDVDLVTWAYERIIPYEAYLTDEDVYRSGLLTCLEKIRTGTTCTCDPGGYQMDNIGRAYEESGLRGILSWAGMDQWSPDRPIPDSLPGKLDTQGTLREMERVVKNWHGAAHGRIRGSYAIRTEPNGSETLFRETKRLGDRDGVLLQMHACVTQAQVDWMKRQTGYSTIEHMDRIGVLDANWLLAHMAAVTEAEIELLARRRVKVSHNPGSTLHGMYGAISRGKFPEMRKAGVVMGTGNDANSANNSLDLFRNMYHLATVHKDARMDPTLFPPEDVVEIVTIEGAQAVMWDSAIGSLEPGKQADVIIVETKWANWVPVHDFNIVGNLCYAADGRDVLTTIVDGQILMEERQFRTIDPGDILERAQYASEQVVKRLPFRLQPRWPIV